MGVENKILNNEVSWDGLNGNAPTVYLTILCAVELTLPLVNMSFRYQWMSIFMTNFRLAFVVSDLLRYHPPGGGAGVVLLLWPVKPLCVGARRRYFLASLCMNGWKCIEGLYCYSKKQASLLL